MKIIKLISFFLCLICWQQQVAAHGGVGMENDQCVIKIGFLKAHFFGYQRVSDDTQEFCEDAPAVTESIFVIEYLHDYLKEMRVDFRIISDVNGLGRYANWQDIVALKTLEQDTVYFLPPAVYPDGALRADYLFKEAGDYIGIVTAEHPEKKKTYRAVFYFQVGGYRYQYIALLVAILLLVQFLYWYFGSKHGLPNSRLLKTSSTERR